MTIATLLVALSLAVPECRALAVGDDFQFRFDGPAGAANAWRLTQLEPSVPMMVAHVSDHGEGVRTTFVFRAGAPGVKTLVFRRGAGPDAPRYMAVLFVAPGKAGR